MFQLFKTLLDSVKDQQVAGAGHVEHTGLNQPQLASVALMMMVANADFALSEHEADLTRQYLQKEFTLTPAQVNAAYDEAVKLAHDAISLHEFTASLKQLSYEQRLQLLSSLWQLAYADDKLDPNEEAMVRKIADLLFIRHSDYIQCKLAVSEGR